MGILMDFPFRINTETLEGEDIKYSQEAYNSVLKQMSDGVEVHYLYVSRSVGKTIRVEEDRIFVELDESDHDVIALLAVGEDNLFVGTLIEADIEIDKDGINSVVSAKVHYILIVPKNISLEFLKGKKDQGIIIRKEKTLNFKDYAEFVGGI
jgi:hypothetical protein